MRAPFRLRLAGWGFSSVPPRTVKKSPRANPARMGHPRSMGTTFNPIGGWPTPRFYRELLNRVPHSAFGWRGGAFRLFRGEPSRNPHPGRPSPNGAPDAKNHGACTRATTRRPSHFPIRENRLRRYMSFRNLRNSFSDVRLRLWAQDLVCPALPVLRRERFAVFDKSAGRGAMVNPQGNSASLEMHFYLCKYLANCFRWKILPATPTRSRFCRESFKVDEWNQDFRRY